MATVIIPSTTFTATATLNLFLGTRVNVNTEALGIAWVKNKQYRIELTEGFIKEVGKNISPNPAINNLTTITTNSTDPTIQSTSPADNATNVTNNNNITITFNRGIKVGTGTIRLYKSDNILIRTYTLPTAKVTFPTLSSVKIDVLGDLVANQGYYLLMDAGTILDKDGFSFAGISSSATLNYTTAASTNVDFPDLISSMSLTATLSAVTFIKEPIRITMSRNAEFALTCNAIAVTPNTAYLLDATGIYLYVEDTGSQLAFVPIISDYLYVNAGGTGNYTLTITPDNIQAVSLMSATNATFNNTTKVLTFTGTINQINNSLDFVSFTPQSEFANSFTLIFTVTTPQGNTQTKNLTVNLGTPLDIEITNMNVSRSYQTNRKNFIFATTTPFISDFDSTPNTQYTMTFTCSNGFIESQSSSTFTGNKTQLNNQFANLKYFPPYNFSANTTFTFLLVKNNNTLANVTVNLTRVGNVENLLPTNLKIITVAPLSANEVLFYEPTTEESLYGKAEILMIGKGGDGQSGIMGGGAGGSAGEVLHLQNQTISQNIITAVPQPATDGYVSGFISVQTGSGESRVRNGLNGRWMFDNEGYSEIGGVTGSSRNYSEYYSNTNAGPNINGGVPRIDNGELPRRGMSNPINGALSAVNTGGGFPLSSPYDPPQTSFFSSFNGFAYGGSAGAGGSGTAAQLVQISSNTTKVTLGLGGPGIANNITGTSVTYAVGGPGGSNITVNRSINESPISTTYGSGGRGPVAGDNVFAIFATSGIKGAIIIKITAK